MKTLKKYKNLFKTAIILSLLINGATIQAQSEFVSPSFSYNSSKIIFSDDSFSLLDIRYKQYSLGDGIESYVIGNSVYLALADIVAIYELPLQISGPIATGWIFHEENKFFIKPANNAWSVTIGEKVETAKNDDIIFHNNLLYVRTDLLDYWLKTTTTLNFSESTLTVETTQKLPFEARIERRARRGSSLTLNTPSTMPLLKQPYKLFEIPSIDANLSYNKQNNRKTDQNYPTKKQYSLISYGDLGYMNARTFITGNNFNGLSGANINLTRRDHTGSMLGFLHASSISIGDTSGGSNAGSGRGITIANANIISNALGSTTIIDGEYHPGWDVELYYNGIMLANATIGDDGYYSFKDMPLLAGNNHFTIKFYGPAGKEEQEQRNIFLGSNNEDLRKLKYSLSLTQPNKNIFNINNSNDNGEEYEQINFDSDMAITSFLSINGGYEYRDKENGIDFSRYNLGLQTRFNQFSLSAGIITGDEEEYGYIDRYNVGISGSFSTIAMLLSTEQYKDIADDAIITTDIDIPDNQYLFSLSGSIYDISITAHQRQTNYLSRVEEVSSIGLSGRYKKNNWSNYFSRNLIKQISTNPTSSNNGEGNNETIRGAFSLSRSFRPLSTHLTLNYDIEPETRLNTALLSTSFNLYKSTTLNTQVSYDVRSDNTNYRASLNWKTRWFSLIPTISYSESGLFSGTLHLYMSLDKRTNRYGYHSYHNLNSARSASKGTFKANLFEDLNLNGQLDQDEPLIEGTKITLNQFRRKGESNAKGEIWLDNIPAWRPTDISVQSGTGLLAPMGYTGKDFSIIARPGSVIGVNIPLAKISEVEIKLSRKEGDKEYNATGVIADLVEDNSKRKYTLSSNSHGYIQFSDLLPGKYTLTIRGERILNPSDAKFVIAPQNSTYTYVQIFLPKQELPIDDLFSVTTDSTIKNILPSTVKIPLFNNGLNTGINSATNLSNDQTDIVNIATQVGWNIQVASYKQSALAENLANQLKQSGIDSFTRSTEVNGTAYVRVYAGSFESRALAQAAISNINNITGTTGFIVNLK